FITLLLAASIFLSNPMAASAFPVSEDGYEENDTVETAVGISLGEYLYLCQADDDFYIVEVPENYTLKVDISFEHILNDMELEFFNEFGLLYGSYSVDSYETLQHTAMETENITIHVYGYNNAESYNMSVQMWDATPPNADVEPNNNMLEAKEIWPNYNSGNNQSDDDWFKIWVHYEGELEINLYYDNGPGFLDMELFYSNGTSLLNASGDYLEWTNPFEGQYFYFKISGPNLGQIYTLDIFINYNPSEDGYEDNDFYWDPAFAYLDFYEISLVSSDDDFYEFTLYPGDYVEVNIWCDSWINLTLAQIDPTTGVWLQWDNTTDDENLYLSISAEVNENHTIGVFGDYSGDLYSMSIHLYSDVYEDNDDFYNAWDLNSGYYGGLQLHDEDWFRFELYGHESLSVDLYPADWESSGFYMYLYDSSYNHIASAWETGSEFRIEWNNPNDYSVYVYMQVVGHYDGDMYDLWANIGPSDDWAEPNDELGQAWDLPLGWTNGLVQFDEDWFRIWMEPNDDLHIDHYYDWADYNTMNLTLFDEYGSELTWNGWVHSLDWTNNAGYGQYVYLRVIGDNQGDWYDFNVLINGQGSNDDWAEENDDYQNYYYLGPGYYTNLFNYDDDYFAIDLTANTTLKVWVHYEAYNWLRLEWVDEFDGHTIMSDESWTDGELFLEIYADHDGKYFIAIKGDNMGEWYDLQLDTDGDDPASTDPTGTDDPTKTDDQSDSENPFGNLDLSNIPGYPIEMVGGVMLVAILALIIPLKKKFLR
ncbi:MAG: hypothetical protein ACTSVZ_10450, partial [Promethearchaeota archaeon]